MEQKLHVKLSLVWQKGDEYRAVVMTDVTDSCYAPVSIRMGLPSGMTGVPEMAYITAELSHDGDDCKPVTKKTIEQTIDGVHSSGKPQGVTAFVTIGNEVVGSDHQAFPR